MRREQAVVCIMCLVNDENDLRPTNAAFRSFQNAEMGILDYALCREKATIPLPLRRVRCQKKKKSACC